MDTSDVLRDLQSMPGVSNVHDLHIWAMTNELVAMSVHIVADDTVASLKDAQKVARRHGIKHTTIQMERCGTEDLVRCRNTNTTCAMKLFLRDPSLETQNTADSQSLSGDSPTPDLHTARVQAAEKGTDKMFVVDHPHKDRKHVDGCGHLVTPPPTGS